MAKEKRSKKIGGGMAERTITETVFDMRHGLEDSEWNEIKASITNAASKPLWDQSEAVALADDWLNDLLSDRPAEFTANHFVPHSDWGWYCHEIILNDRKVRSSIEKGAAERAAFWAGKFTEALVELQMRLRNEGIWEIGKRYADNSTMGASLRRKRSAEERIRQVDEIAARLGSKRAAFKIVAKREHSHPKTIEGDYYKNRPRPLT